MYCVGHVDVDVLGFVDRRFQSKTRPDCDLWFVITIPWLVGFITSFDLCHFGLSSHITRTCDITEVLFTVKLHPLTTELWILWRVLLHYILLLCNFQHRQLFLLCRHSSILSEFILSVSFQTQGRYDGLVNVSYNNLPRQLIILPYRVCWSSSSCICLVNWSASLSMAPVVVVFNVFYPCRSNTSTVDGCKPWGGILNRSCMTWSAPAH